MLPYLLLSLALMALRQAPPGTQLHVRLTSAVGSYGSKPGSPVSAVLIAPVTVGGETLLPEGSMLTGRVKSVRRVGYGIVHETAGINLKFDRVTLADGESFPLSTRLEQVDNGRERVAPDGGIHGVRSTGSLSYRVSGYIRTALCWDIHAGLAFWAIKTLIVQVPEPEIYFPAGVEFTLALTGPLLSSGHAEPEQIARTLTAEERASLEPVVAAMPYRASVPVTDRPADLINTMFIGTREEITAAFMSAGWTKPRPVSMRARIRGVEAVAEGLGYRSAPMSSLLLNDAPADMSWQKGLDSFAKRDHIRIWKQSVTWDGQEVWAGAATRDVDYAYMRSRWMITHKIEEDLDQERDKVAHDLEFTSCADVVDWWDRPDLPRFARNATGDPMNTDARLAVIRLNDCQSLRQAAPADDSAPLPARGNSAQRFLRREILMARSDVLRTNIYWRGYEGVRWTIAAIRRRRQAAASADLAAADHPASSPRRASRVSSYLFSRDRMDWLR
jgi:hypothetical protein